MTGKSIIATYLTILTISLCSCSKPADISVQSGSGGPTTKATEPATPDKPEPEVITPPTEDPIKQSIEHSQAEIDPIQTSASWYQHHKDGEVYYAALVSDIKKHFMFNLDGLTVNFEHAMYQQWLRYRPSFITFDASAIDRFRLMLGRAILEEGRFLEASENYANCLYETVSYGNLRMYAAVLFANRQRRARQSRLEWTLNRMRLDLGVEPNPFELRLIARLYGKVRKTEKFCTATELPVNMTPSYPDHAFDAVY